MSRPRLSDGRTRRQPPNITPLGVDDRLIVDAEELATDLDRDGLPVTADLIRLAIRMALREATAGART